MASQNYRRQEAITWDNIGPDLFSHMALLSHNAQPYEVQLLEVG